MFRHRRLVNGFERFSVAGIFFVLCVAAAAPASAAATIWDGPLTVFTEPDPALGGAAPTNQDRLTPDVWLTRNVTQGFINAFSETTYTHYSSPAGTEWAFGNLADWGSLTYTSWEGMFGGSIGGGPNSTLNRSTVVHLINDDIYLGLTLTNWGGSGGGFAYLRTTPHLSLTPIPLEISRSGNQVILSWTNSSFSLQSATNVTGPYETVTGAVSPYTNSPSASQEFFRLLH
jgi:hypothetical protein